MYPFFILLLALAPWKSEYHQALFDMRVVVREFPCDWAAWAEPDRTIYLCPAPGDRWEWLGLHESQHIMAWTYLPDINWDLFAHVAMKALYNGDYTDEQIALAEYYLTYGGGELHAELPWILHGDLPSSLQQWYPWFDLSSLQPLASARSPFP